MSAAAVRKRKHIVSSDMGFGTRRTELVSGSAPCCGAWWFPGCDVSVSEQFVIRPLLLLKGNVISRTGNCQGPGCLIPNGKLPPGRPGVDRFHFSGSSGRDLWAVLPIEAPGSPSSPQLGKSNPPGPSCSHWPLNGTRRQLMLTGGPGDTRVVLWPCSAPAGLSKLQAGFGVLCAQTACNLQRTQWVLSIPRIQVCLVLLCLIFPWSRDQSKAVCGIRGEKV